MSELLLIPLEDSVVFPGMSVTLAVDTGGADRVLLVPVHEGAYASVGTVAATYSPAATWSTRLPIGPPSRVSCTSPAPSSSFVSQSLTSARFELGM